MTHFSSRCIAPLTVALLLSTAACGGSVDESVFAEPGQDAAAGEDTSATTETGGPIEDAPIGTDGTPPPVDGGPADTTPPDTGTPVTIDNVCTRLADTVCTSALSSCCGTKGLVYNEAGCKIALQAQCGKQVQSVKDGKSTFDAAAFGACASAWSSLTTKCSMPIFDFAKSYAACNQLFNGTAAPGATCTDDWQCKVSPGAFANCTDAAPRRCEATTIAGLDQPCVYGGSTPAYCDYGLWCRRTDGTTMSSCRPAKALNDTCSSSLECGFGNYCPLTSGTRRCAVALAAGAACTYDEACASGNCNVGKCTDPNVSVASAALCSGTI